MSATLYFALVSAFLASVYLVGDRLSKAQAALAAAIYLAWVSFLPIGQYTYSKLQAIAVDQLISLNSNFISSSADIIVLLSLWFMVLQYIAVAATLYFMWSVRRPESGQ